MEISFVLDWVSFWVGVGATVLSSVIGLFTAAAVQYYKMQGKGLGSRGGRSSRI